MKQFIIKNKVIIAGILSALLLVFQQFQGKVVDPKIFAFACLLGVLGVVANNWKLKGATILGIIGTAAEVFKTTAESGNFTWTHFGSCLMIAVLLAFTSEFNVPVATPVITPSVEPIAGPLPTAP